MGSTATAVALWKVHAEQVQQLTAANHGAYGTLATPVLDKSDTLIDAAPAAFTALLEEKVPLQICAAWHKVLVNAGDAANLPIYAGISQLRFLYFMQKAAAGRQRNIVSLAQQLQQSGLLQLLPVVYTDAAQNLAGFSASVAAGQLQCSDAPFRQTLALTDARSEIECTINAMLDNKQHQQDWLLLMHLHINRLVHIHGMLQCLWAGLPGDQALDLLPDGSACIPQLTEAVLRHVSVCTQQISGRGQVPPSDLLNMARQAVVVFVEAAKAVSADDEGLEELLRNKPRAKQLLQSSSYLFCLAASCLVAAQSDSLQAAGVEALPGAAGAAEMPAAAAAAHSSSSDGGSSSQHSTAAASSTRQRSSAAAAEAAAAWEAACKLFVAGGWAYELAGQCGLDARLLAAVAADQDVYDVQPCFHIPTFAYINYLAFCEKQQEQGPQASSDQQQGRPSQSMPVVASQQQQQQSLHLTIMAAMLQHLAAPPPAERCSLWLTSCMRLVDCGRILLRLSKEQGWWDKAAPVEAELAASVLECHRLPAQQRQQQQGYVQLLNHHHQQQQPDVEVAEWPERMLSAALQIFEELRRQYDKLDCPDAAAAAAADPASSSPAAAGAAAQAECALAAATIEGSNPAAAALCNGSQSSSTSQSRPNNTDSEQQQQQQDDDDDDDAEMVVGCARHKCQLLACMSGFVDVCSSVMECCVIQQQPDCGSNEATGQGVVVRVKHPWRQYATAIMLALEEFVRTAAAAGKLVEQHDASSRLTAAFNRIVGMCAIAQARVGLLAACAMASPHGSDTRQQFFTLLVSMQKALLLPGSCFAVATGGSCLLSTLQVLRVLFVSTLHEANTQAASSSRSTATAADAPPCSRDVVHSLLSCLMLFGRLCLSWSATIRMVLELHANFDTQAAAATPSANLHAAMLELQLAVLLLQLFADLRSSCGSLTAEEMHNARCLAAGALQILASESDCMAAFATDCSTFISAPSSLQLLTAEGYDALGLQQQLNGFAAVVQQHLSSLQATDGTEKDAWGSLQQSCTELGVALNTLAVPWACNNPKCSNLSGASELSLVLGKNCKCAGCRVAHYCSRTCKKQHWKQHKPVCKALAAAAAAAVVQSDPAAA